MNGKLRSSPVPREASVLFVREEKSYPRKMIWFPNLPSSQMNGTPQKMGPLCLVRFLLVVIQKYGGCVKMVMNGRLPLTIEQVKIEIVHIAASIQRYYPA